jgi:dipeptidyl aminopeptidase/acylaminoacyl peptidase
MSVSFSFRTLGRTERTERTVRNAHLTRPVRTAPRRSLLPALLLAAVTSGTFASWLSVAPLEAQTPQRVVGHEVYELWRTIGTRAISPDGRWVLYSLEGETAETELVIREVSSAREFRIPRGAGAQFTRDGGFALYTIRPDTAVVRELREARTAAADMPRDTLAILSLARGEITKIPDVRTWRVPSDIGRWVFYHLDPQGSLEAGEETAPRNGTLVMRELSTGSETRFPDVTSFSFPNDAARIVLQESPRGDDGLIRLRTFVPGDATPTAIFEGRGAVRSVTLSSAADQLLFVHAPPAEGDAGSDAVVRLWRAGTPETRVILSNAHPGIQDGWSLAEPGSYSFSEDGRRVLFSTQPPAWTPPELTPLQSRVDVEIWHWEDPALMTVQNLRVNQDRRRSFSAMLDIESGRMVQLADDALASVTITERGNGALAIGTDNRAYQIEGSWESPNYTDVYLVDVATGTRTLFLERSQGTPSLSPGGRYLTWYQPGERTWFAHDLTTGTTRSISDALPYPIHNEDHDSPSNPGSYGNGGWMEGDQAILLYDRFDVWAVDPSGAAAPRNLTQGAGRAQSIRFRIVRLEGESGPFAPNAPVWLSAFSPATKQAGFFRTDLSGTRAPTVVVLEDRKFSTPVKAADADVFLYSQETFVDFPDLWVSAPDFRNRQRVSHANPQQAEYRWGTAELMEWISADGIPLQGVLMKPDNFDPTRKYPMVVYFYERWSDGLHDHYPLTPHRSRIAFPMYTSDDYIVFIPDIVYRDGYPGEGAINAVNPGIFKLIEAGFVDRERIALQGHSWGGYQIAFMVTRSQNLYRAAAAGAPVANMTSAYGGIRRETGLVRQFQYERTQSRLGGTLWDMPMRYIENSPLFWVDKIETPLLIMHNDNDGHVPWEQGIELFVAMRRLGKPAWMVNYRGEPHWPTTFPNRVDWNVRMKQFFDHFLKDAPPPVWMVEGIPAVRRGETLGYEPVPGASVTTPRNGTGGN